MATSRRMSIKENTRSTLLSGLGNEGLTVRAHEEYSI